MKLTDYIPIQAWMRKLQLTDKQLIAYAMIQSYSRDGQSRWRATSKLLAEWLCCTDRHARRIICELEERGLVDHEVVFDRRSRHNVTEFWAIAPEDAKPRKKDAKDRINWAGKGPSVADMDVLNNKDTDVLNVADMDVLNHNSSSNRDSKYYSNYTGKLSPHTPKGGFVPPTVEEVAAYAKDNGFADPQGFAAYYVAYQSEAGWITGKGSKTKPIDNWKLNVLAWGKYRKNEIFSQQPAPAASEPVSMSPEEFDSLFR